ncbi:hypothetical protein D3C84_1020870 [compost metagenome]
MASPAMACKASGLRFGPDRKIARVRGVIALASAVASAEIATCTSLTPQALSDASQVRTIGSRTITSSPAASRHIDVTNKAFCAPSSVITLAVFGSRLSCLP